MYGRVGVAGMRFCVVWAWTKGLSRRLGIGFDRV